MVSEEALYEVYHLVDLLDFLLSAFLLAFFLYRNVSTPLRQLHMIGMARRALYIPEYVLLLWLQVEDQVARRLSAVTGDSAHQEGRSKSWHLSKMKYVV